MCEYDLIFTHGASINFKLLRMVMFESVSQVSTLDVNISWIMDLLH